MAEHHFQNENLLGGGAFRVRFCRKFEFEARRDWLFFARRPCGTIRMVASS
jgi:hypothetical protein